MRKRRPRILGERQGEPPRVDDGLLTRLSGLRMYSVEFVLDYVQLRFDGDEIKGGPVVLNSYVWPRVDDGVRSWREADLGYADALRGLIPATVRSTAESTKTGLRLEFDRRAIVIQPAIEEVYVEIAVLQGFDDGSWTVWHPGEGCFGDLGRDE